MTQVFESDLKRARLVTYQTWLQRPWHEKMVRTPRQCYRRSFEVTCDQMAAWLSPGKGAYGKVDVVTEADGVSRVDCYRFLSALPKALCQRPPCQRPPCRRPPFHLL